MIKIEKNVPIPYKKIDSLRSQFSEALKKMHPGDSFHVPSQRQATVRLAAKESNVKIVIRSENGTNVRVWKKEESVS